MSHGGRIDELRVGIVGLGAVAGAHVATFKNVKGARVTAVCSRRDWAAADLEGLYGLPLKAYTDYEAFVADPEIDVVDICTPHHRHAQQAITAARARKHLLIEKPVALQHEDAVAVRKAIQDAGVLACVGFECRFSSHFTLVRSMLDQGLLGEVHYGEVDYFHGIGPWSGQFSWNVRKACGGSSLLTAGCHALDGLLFFMGGRVEEVVSYATRSRSALFAPYEYPTTTTTILKFEDGRIGKVASVIDCLQPYHLRVHLVGSEGSILDDRFTSTRLPGLDRTRWSTLATAVMGSGDAKDHPYEPQFQAFIDGIHAGQPMPHTDFETAFETHRVIFAADRSLELGRPVRLSELS
jgi:predicted dehydrogenase